MNARIAAALLAPALLLLADGACAGDRRKSLDGRIDPALLYHNYCSVCHGDQGDGRSRARGSLVPPPANFTDPQLASRYTVPYMDAIIREGKAGTAMVGWKTQLTPPESRALAEYVRARFVEKAGTDTARRGRALYEHFCASCHGPTGRGPEATAPVRVGQPPAPDLAKAEGLTRERIIVAIAVGKPAVGKPGFAQQLAPADIEAVAEHLKLVLATPAAGVSGSSAHGGKAGGPR
ncbi:MAG TPA: c-type cytochrome [Usitatibacteraceae bacterium]|nr:c-type cytochrome [Usitatibacteraceae bacterium]